MILRFWLLVVLACVGAFAPSRACARTAETRTWDFFATATTARPESAPQVAETHQGFAVHGYELALGFPQASENVVPQVLRNQAAGDLGEAAVRARLLNSKTVDLVGEQIRINTPGAGSHRYVDFLVRGKETGILRIIEVKTGGATRDAAQLAKDALIADPLAPTTFSGRAARAAGFPNGTPTGPIRTFEVNASNLNH